MYVLWLVALTCREWFAGQFPLLSFIYQKVQLLKKPAHFLGSILSQFPGSYLSAEFPVSGVGPVLGPDPGRDLGLAWLRPPPPSGSGLPSSKPHLDGSGWNGGKHFMFLMWKCVLLEDFLCTHYTDRTVYRHFCPQVCIHRPYQKDAHSGNWVVLTSGKGSGWGARSIWTSVQRFYFIGAP